MSFEEIKTFMNKRGWIYDPLQMEFRKRFGSKVVILEKVILEVEDENNNLSGYVDSIEQNKEQYLL